MNRYHARKARWCATHTAALRDDRWREPYEQAVARIAEHARRRALWVKVKLPFACDDEQEAAYEDVLSVATRCGYERRPGGTSGYGYDLVFFELTAVVDPADDVEWAA